MSKRNLILFSLIGMFIVGTLILLGVHLVSAENIPSLGEIKQGDSILLKQNCVNNTYTNITSISVNGIQTKELISNAIQMNLVSEGYQTYNFTNSSYLGQYIVTGICNENGIIKSWSYNYIVTPAGTTLNTVQISIYIFSLILCLVLVYGSVRIFKTNKMSKSLTGQESYQLKKRNEFLYYMSVLKKQLWTVGIFGVYLSCFIFVSILTQLVYNLGLSDLNEIFRYITLFFAWGFIPFILFWFGWLAFTIYKSTVDIFKYQFGSWERIKHG